MTWDNEMGTVKSVSRCEGDDGRVCLRVIVEFYDGHCPDITFNTVWKEIPVKIVKCPTMIEEHYHVPGTADRDLCICCGQAAGHPIHKKPPPRPEPSEGFSY